MADGLPEMADGRWPVAETQLREAQHCAKARQQRLSTARGRLKISAYGHPPSAICRPFQRVRSYHRALIALFVASACGRGGAARPAPVPTRATPRWASGRWVRIVATNDFHGALEPRRDSRGVLRGGAAVLAAEIRKARAEGRARGP